MAAHLRTLDDIKENGEFLEKFTYTVFDEVHERSLYFYANPVPTFVFVYDDGKYTFVNSADDHNEYMEKYKKSKGYEIKDYTFSEFDDSNYAPFESELGETHHIETIKSIGRLLQKSESWSELYYVPALDIFITCNTVYGSSRQHYGLADIQLRRTYGIPFQDDRHHAIPEEAFIL